MNPQFFRQLLTELNPKTVAPFSTINHHVRGMDYLCLHRSAALTVKLYIIDPAFLDRERGDLLVTPHTHRYAFETWVLAGSIAQELYKESTGTDYGRYDYAAETKRADLVGHCDLISVDAPMVYERGESYWNDTDSIHTLITPLEPVLLGLVQMRDTHATSTTYIRTGTTLQYPASRAPSSSEADQLRKCALSMIDNG
jgi:hypothetical protein